MSCRTDTIVQTRHVLHMAVIGLVQILTVPAGLEMDLGTETVDTASTRHVWLLRARPYIQAGEAHTIRNRTVAARDELSFVIGAESRVSGNHSETWWKGLELRSATKSVITQRTESTYLQVRTVVATAFVIDGHTLIGDFFKRAVRMLIIEDWRPVGGQVSTDFTRRAWCFLKSVISGAGINVACAGDLVGMWRDNSRINNRINTTSLNDATGLLYN